MPTHFDREENERKKTRSDQGIAHMTRRDETSIYIDRREKKNKIMTESNLKHIIRKKETSTDTDRGGRRTHTLTRTYTYLGHIRGREESTTEFERGEEGRRRKKKENKVRMKIDEQKRRYRKLDLQRGGE